MLMTFGFAGSQQNGTVSAGTLKAGKRPRTASLHRRRAAADPHILRPGHYAEYDSKRTATPLIRGRDVVLNVVSTVLGVS